MLSPRQSSTRECISLNELWRFALDPRGIGRAERWWASVLPGDSEMPVPASFNDVVPTREARHHVGDVWYQRTVRVPRGWDGQRIVLRFDAATHRAIAWVGDTQVVEHEGGYTPFEADVTEHVSAGEEARVTIVVNNELSWSSIPPGFVQERDDGRRVQQYFHDFFNYAGFAPIGVAAHDASRFRLRHHGDHDGDRRRGRRGLIPGRRRGWRRARGEGEGA